LQDFCAKCGTAMGVLFDPIIWTKNDILYCLFLMPQSSGFYVFFWQVSRTVKCQISESQKGTVTKWRPDYPVWVYNEPESVSSNHSITRSIIALKLSKTSLPNRSSFWMVCHFYTSSVYCGPVLFSNAYSHSIQDKNLSGILMSGILMFTVFGFCERLLNCEFLKCFVILAFETSLIS
jgi:hypothetical protein